MQRSLGSKSETVDLGINDAICYEEGQNIEEKIALIDILNSEPSPTTHSLQDVFKGTVSQKLHPMPNCLDIFSADRPQNITADNEIIPLV